MDKPKQPDFRAPRHQRAGDSAERVVQNIRAETLRRMSLGLADIAEMAERDIIARTPYAPKRRSKTGRGKTPKGHLFYPRQPHLRATIKVTVDEHPRGHMTITARANAGRARLPSAGAQQAGGMADARGVIRFKDYTTLGTGAGYLNAMRDHWPRYVRRMDRAIKRGV